MTQRLRWKDVIPGSIVDALNRIGEIIEATYGHDEHGERDDDAEPEESAADIVEKLANAGLLFDEAIEALDEFVDISSTGRA